MTVTTDRQAGTQAESVTKYDGDHGQAGTQAESVTECDGDHRQTGRHSGRVCHRVSR